MNITAPTHKDHLPRVIKDLEELKLAFLEKGDEERDYAKAKFLKYCGHKVEIKTPKAVQPEEDKKALEEGEEVSEAPVKVSSDKLRLVEKIISQKFKQQSSNQRDNRGRRGGRDDEGGVELGEEGMSIDAYEANYAGANDDEDNYDNGEGPERGAARGGPLADSGSKWRDDNSKTGSRGGRGGRGGRGADRGGRGGRGGYDDRERGNYDDRRNNQPRYPKSNY